MKKIILFVPLIFILLLSACNQSAVIESVEIQNTLGNPIELEETTTQVIPPQISKTETPEPSSANLSEKELIYSLWISDLVPEEISRNVLQSNNFQLHENEAGSDLTLDLEFLLDKSSNSKIISRFSWVYALTAAFPVLLDDVKASDLENVWKGEQEEIYNNNHFLMADDTYQIFLQLWGRPAKNCVTVIKTEDLLESAWEDQTAWVILPFEEISPRWKVISINGVSPIDNDYSGEDYPLEVKFVLSLNDPDLPEPQLNQTIPFSNRDPQKFTSLVMTGTTALVRYTAQRMEVNGIDYPAQDILPWLLDADLTHISNEVSFYEDCPPADPVRREQRFCSSPDYYELLEYIDVDIVELTGNHMLDWGVEPFLYTLEMYREHDLPYFGGGINLAEARQPLLVEHNGNKLYFIGCSPAGPENVWATEETAGSNPCDNDWMQAQISFADQNGYIPIVTFQHWEVEDYRPHSSQRVDFLNAAKMGAAIVSGSQSHFPQSMTLFEDTFIHFGLGNLFFDQMYGDNLHEFIDRHVFYDGKYINTELLTAMLEDYAKPRPMTDGERKEFLEEVFSFCNWELQE